MLGQIQQLSGFKTLDVDINVPARLFSKSIQQWPKWPFSILKIAFMSIIQQTDVDKACPRLIVM